jgi:hypothetical protein
MLAWMRTLSGTTSLRAILYFDEVFGFFPPYPYNPPTKDPLLRMLKQARAFGLGLVLATQNPGDLDYKGLSNAGTWFIGKLQTENDKKKVLNGLESMSTVESAINIANLDQLLSSISPRVFVMNNIHDNSGPIPIHTRWAMSYLRGPLTRQQIRQLMADQRQQPYYPAYQAYQQPPQVIVPSQSSQVYGTPVIQEPAVQRGSTPLPPSLPEMPGFAPEQPAVQTPPTTLPDYAANPPVRPSVMPPQSTQPVNNFQQGYTQPTGSRQVTGSTGRNDSNLPEGYTMTQPPLPSATPQYFLPSTLSMEQAVTAWEKQTGMSARTYGGSITLYKPFLIAQAQVRYSDRKSNVNMIDSHAFHIPHVDKAGLVHWDEYNTQYIDPKDFSQTPFGEAAFGALSPGLTDSRRMTALKTDLIDYIYKSAGVVLMYNPQLDLYAQPGQRKRDFLVQAQNLARQRRDEEIDKISAAYEKQFDALELKMRKQVRDLASDRKQLDAVKSEEMFTTGEAVLSLLRGRTTYTLSRVSRARRYKGNIQDGVYESEAMIADIEDQMEILQQRMEQELAQVNAKWGDIAGISEEYRITPFKKDIYLDAFGIGWKPHWMIVVNGQPTLLPAWGS